MAASNSMDARRASLSDVFIKQLKPPVGKPAKHSDSLGMYLYITPTGVRSFRLDYRHDGKRKTMVLGQYPDTSLAEARRRRDGAREQLDQGVDPMGVRKVEKFERRIAAENTFGSVARAWWQHWKGSRTDHHADYVLRRLEADVFPSLGTRPISSIKTPDLVQMALAIQERGALDIAKRQLQTCGQIFRFAVQHGLCEHNPCIDIKPAEVLKTRKETNYARIEAKELPELLRRMEGYRGSNVTRFAIKLLAMTFVRTTELIEAKWTEFDLEGAQWRIPGERMKMRVEHIVPLSTQAVALLKSLHALTGHSPYLFPGTRDHDKPMSNNTILKALEIMGYKHRMTGHGFRGVASTSLHEMGFEHEHIEIQLAHAPRSSVSASYNWAQYLPARAKMMQFWSDYLDKCLASNVVKLETRAAA
jgi:integrase